MNQQWILDQAKRLADLREAGAVFVRITLNGLTSVYILANGHLELDNGPGFALPDDVEAAIIANSRMGSLNGYCWSGEVA